MKILALQTTSVFEQYGGVEYYLDDLLKAFASIHGSESIVSIIPQRAPFRTFPVASSDTYRTVAVPSARTGLLRRFQNRLPFQLILRALTESRQLRPDRILCGHVSLGPAVYCLSKWLRVPYISVVYGIDCWGNLFPQDEWCLRRSDKIISISHWTKNQLVERGYPPSKIEVIHPIIAADLVNKRRVHAPNKTFSLLTVSRLDSRERYKGHDDVLEALAQLRKRSKDRSFRYTIQGSGDDRSRLIQKTQDLNLSDWVDFVDATHSRSELRLLYAKADLFIMPSRFGIWDGRWRGEGFGIVYAEAGALGVPSIAYRCGGATDIIEHGKTGLLVTPDNIPELAHSMEYCMDNPDQLAALGENARVRVNSLFTFEQMKGAAARLFSGHEGDRL